MDSSAVIEAFRALLLMSLKVTFPALMASLVVAVVFGVLQAVMQIQEQSLSFFPKMLVLGFVFYYLGPWMLDGLIVYVKEFINLIPSLL